MLSRVADLLSTEIESFIGRNIDTVEDLEILLLLQGSPERFWAVDEVAAELRLSPAAAHSILDRLCSRNLLDVKTTTEVMFCFRPTTDELRGGVLALAAAYRRSRLRVLAALYTSKHKRARDFADAFLIKKGDKNG
jgi:hypothetical protein